MPCAPIHQPIFLRPEIMKGVLITRPEPGASDTAARIAALGHRPVLAPCMNVAPAAPIRLEQDPVAILATSAQALAALIHLPRGIRFLAVGDATAQQARDHGFSDVISAGGNAADLAMLIRRTVEPKSGVILFAAGAEQGLQLAGQLRRGGYRITRRVAYRASGASALPDQAVQALRGGEISKVLLFSGQTAASFSRLMRQHDLVASCSGVEALVLSEQVAIVAQGLPWAQIRVALAPNQDEILALLT
ncbi:MAG: hypothetical protein B7Z78_05875 [Rhodospirillales bacterium 20-60-12]|nr:MAG: hypothetical protein B7Z78_05875 [Rhodospirillales bacterium 20-60-12]